MRSSFLWIYLAQCVWAYVFVCLSVCPPVKYNVLTLLSSKVKTSTHTTPSVDLTKIPYLWTSDGQHCNPFCCLHVGHWIIFPFYFLFSFFLYYYYYYYYCIWKTRKKYFWSFTKYLSPKKPFLNDWMDVFLPQGKKKSNWFCSYLPIVSINKHSNTNFFTSE